MKRGDTLEIEINDFAFGGKGIGRLEINNETLPVFVENTIPGQIVEARISNKRKKYIECKLIRVLKKSNLEVESPYQPISGAPYITLPISNQKEYKLKSTLEVYKRLGRIYNIEDIFDEYIDSPLHFNYRNKMEYSFSTIRQDIEKGVELDDKFALGFKTRGTWWKVENLDKESGLFDIEFETKIREIREFLEKTNLPAWHPPKKIGFYRHIVVRKSFDSNQLLVNLVTSSQEIEKFDKSKFTNFMVDLLGNRLAGLQHTINDDVADRSKIENGLNQLLFGNPVVIENLLGLKFEISMESFFQTNPKSAERLYKKAVDYALLNHNLENQIMMDLFCGTGTIGQIFANQIKGVKVIGVDIVKEAIEDAKRNAKRNGVNNLDFYAADVGKFLVEYPEYKNKIHTIILDPPRAGIAPKTLLKVIGIEAKQIVYISCNPATQARDAETLQNEGYVLTKISLVDQFPHTSHIEAVALFEKK